MDWTAKAREWLNKKHFTSDSGVTLDCLAMLPEEHAMAINIRQLCEIMAAFASEVERETRQELAHEIRRLKGIEPSAEEEYLADGWRKIGDTGVWELNGSFSTTLSHYCGLQGFGQSYDDTCPACDAYRDARAILAGVGQGRVGE